MEAPIITLPPLAVHKAAEARNTQLRCQVYGSPKPLVVWKKGSEQLTGGRFVVTEAGHLNISVGSLFVHRMNQRGPDHVGFSWGTFCLDKSSCVLSMSEVCMNQVGWDSVQQKKIIDRQFLSVEVS